MTKTMTILVATALAGGATAPLAAQYPQPQPYPYPQQYPQTYPGYPQQGYGNNAVGQIFDQLLGNRYNVTDRQAIRQCASAAMSQASAQYGGGGGYGGYNQQQYGYNQQYNYNRFRVTAITDVQRRSNGLRVTGLLDSGRRYGGGYGNQGYNNYPNGAGDLSFRCNVDYRGYVTNVRINRYEGYRRY